MPRRAAAAGGPESTGGPARLRQLGQVARKVRRKQWLEGCPLCPLCSTDRLSHGRMTVGKLKRSTQPAGGCFRVPLLLPSPASPLWLAFHSLLSSNTEACRRDARRVASGRTCRLAWRAANRACCPWRGCRSVAAPPCCRPPNAGPSLLCRWVGCMRCVAAAASGPRPSVGRPAAVAAGGGVIPACRWYRPWPAVRPCP